MEAFVLYLLAVLSYCGTQGQVLSRPDNVTVCEGKGAVFTCVLNSNIRSDDVQWYRFTKNTSTTVMVDPNGENINFLTHTSGSAISNRNATNNGSTVNNTSTALLSNESTTSSSLTITNAIISYTGFFWVETPSLNVCNASLTVVTSPSALTAVYLIKNNKSLSIDVQWDAVDDSLHTAYTVTWRDERDLDEVATVDEQTSYTITGLTLDTVYTITVTAANMCSNDNNDNDGKEFRTTVSFSTVISEPDDVTICKGEGAVFTCVLNSNIRSDDVQWYRFIKDTNTTVMVYPNGENINFFTHTNESTTSSSLTIINAIKNYTGYFWVGTPSLNVCNASLTVMGTRPPALVTVNVTKNNENSSIIVQWDAVNDSLHTTYIMTWTSGRDNSAAVNLREQTSYIITGLTLDTVYTITVTPSNMCGQGPKFSTSISLTTSTISSNYNASTNPMTIISTIDSNVTSTTTSMMYTTMVAVISTANNTDPTDIDTTTAIVNPTTTLVSNPTTNPASTTTPNETSDSNVAIIAGAAIGGIIVVIIIVLILLIIIFCFQSRKNVKGNNYSDLSGDKTLNANIPMVTNPLNSNHENEKPKAELSHQISTTEEALYMTSNIGNKKPQQPLKSTPQKDKIETQHQQTMEYDVIDISRKKEQKQQSGETDTQLQQPIAMEYAVVDTSKKKKKDKQQNGKADTQLQQSMEYAVVDKTKKKGRKDKQQHTDGAHKDNEILSDAPTVKNPSDDHASDDNENQKMNNTSLHYAVLQTLPAPTGTYIADDDSCTPYALVS